jgi:MIP family channel proteins
VTIPAGSTILDYPCRECRRECFSELLGTYLLVLIGPASIILVSLTPSIGGLASLLFVAVCFAGAVGLVILTLGKYSGAHINPAVTIAASIAKRLRSSFSVRYVCFQLVGGISAGITLSLFFGPLDRGTHLGSTRLVPSLDLASGIILEALGTLVLASSALLASIYIKSTKKQALLVAITLFILIVLIGPLTGAGFNPARSLGPALASGYLVNQYVYWIGPSIGAVLAGLVMRRIHHGKECKASPLCLC